VHPDIEIMFPFEKSPSPITQTNLDGFMISETMWLVGIVRKEKTAYFMQAKCKANLNIYELSGGINDKMTRIM